MYCVNFKDSCSLIHDAVIQPACLAYRVTWTTLMWTWPGLPRFTIRSSATCTSYNSQSNFSRVFMYNNIVWKNHSYQLVHVYSVEEPFIIIQFTPSHNQCVCTVFSHHCYTGCLMLLGSGTSSQSEDTCTLEKLMGQLFQPK